MNTFRIRLSNKLLWLAIWVLPYGYEKARLTDYCIEEMRQRMYERYMRQILSGS